MQGMSVFAKTVLAQKYLHHETETWQDLANRVGKTVLKAVGAKKDLIDQVVEYINQRKFIPGGRYLYATGRQFHQTQNCYAGETRIVTRYGTKTLKELSGSKTVLMSSKGAWVEAEIKNFGVQDLQKVVIQRAGIKKELFATAGHSWRIAKNLDRKSRRSLTKREATTEQLKTKDYLYQVFGAGILKLKSSLAGIQHGIIFGDGGKPSLKGDKQGFQSAAIRLCGNKNRQILSYFEGYDNYGACSELDKYLEIYAASGKAAAQYADEWDLSKPIKTRAIAPTGTIGIIAETTTSLEPIFCSAFKRRYAKGSVWHYKK